MAGKKSGQMKRMPVVCWVILAVSAAVLAFFALQLPVWESGQGLFADRLYACLCAPMTFLLQHTGGDPATGSNWMNALFYLIALYFVGFRLQASWQARSLGMLLWLVSPALFSIGAANLTLFTMMLLTVSLVQLHGQAYKSAAVLLGIASAGQVLALALVPVYLIVYAGSGRTGGRGWRGWGRYLACFLPVLLNPAYVWIVTGEFTAGYAPDLAGWTAQMQGLLFNELHGMAGFFPVLLLLFVPGVILGAVHGKPEALLLGVGWILLLCAASFFAGGQPEELLFLADVLVWMLPVLQLSVLVGFDQTCPMTLFCMLLVLTITVTAGFLVGHGLLAGISVFSFAKSMVYYNRN